MSLHEQKLHISFNGTWANRPYLIVFSALYLQKWSTFRGANFKCNMVSWMGHSVLNHLFRCGLLKIVIYVLIHTKKAVVFINREIKFDVTWSYVKQQMAKMKLLPSVFSLLNSRVKIFVFEAISRRHFSIFVI